MGFRDGFPRWVSAMGFALDFAFGFGFAFDFAFDFAFGLALDFAFDLSRLSACCHARNAKNRGKIRCDACPHSRSAKMPSVAPGHQSSFRDHCWSSWLCPSIFVRKAPKPREKKEQNLENA
jgi:hypothetical protein